MGYGPTARWPRMFFAYRFLAAACLVSKVLATDWEKLLPTDVDLAMIGASDLEYSSSHSHKIRIGTPILFDELGTEESASAIMAHAYALFFYWLNQERGGVYINGTWHQVEFITIGTKGEYNTSKLVTRYLVEVMYTELLLGPYSSEQTTPMAEVVATTSATMIAPAASATNIFREKPRVFGILSPASQYLVPAFGVVGTRAKSVASIKEDNVFTKEVCSAIPNLADQYGMTVKGPPTGHQLPKEFTEADVSKIVKQMKDEGVEFLVGCVYRKACDMFLNEIQKQGATPLMIVNTICTVEPGFLPAMGEAGRWVGGITPWMPTMDTKSDLNGWSARDFARAYKRVYRQEPTYAAAGAWAACETMITAIERCGSADPAAVAKELRNIDINTVFGRVNFNRATGMNVKPQKIVQFQAVDEELPRIVAPELYQQYELIFPIPPWAQRMCFKELPANSWFGHYGPNTACGICPSGDVIEGQVSYFNHSLQRRMCRGCESLPKCQNKICKVVELPLNQSTCQEQCQAGFAPADKGLEMSKCVACPPGKHSHRFECKPCSLGRFSNTSATSQCEFCKPGKSAAQQGSTKCDECGPGTMANSLEATRCKECAPGKFNNQKAGTQCDMCAPGKVAETASSAGCTICPRGMYSSWNRDRCQDCAPGRYQDVQGSSSCKHVPPGAEAVSGGATYASNKKGYWQLTEWGDDVSEVQDWIPKRWESCHMQTDACLENMECAPGHTGRHCASCLPGHSLSTDGSCFKCYSRTWYIIATIFVIFLLTICMMILAFLIKKGADRQQDTHSILFKQLINHVICATVCSQMIQQIFDEVKHPFEDNLKVGMWIAQRFHWGYGTFPEWVIWSVTCLTEWWPDDNTEKVMRRLDSANQTEYMAPHMQHVWETFRDHLWKSEVTFVCFWIIWPFFLFLTAYTVGFIMLRYNLHRRRDDYAEALDFFWAIYSTGWKNARRKVLHSRLLVFRDCYYDWIFELWHPVRHARCFKRTGRIDYKHFGKECRPIRSAVVFVTFGSVVHGMVRAVHCAPRMYVEKDEIIDVIVVSRAEIKCSFDHMDALFIMPAVGILCWCVVFPFYLFRSLRKLEAKRKDDQVGSEDKVDFALLINGYKPECWFWEVFMYFRKSTQIVLVAVPFRLWHDNARPLVFLLFAVICAVFHLRYKPYDQRSNNLLDQMEWYQLTFWIITASFLSVLQNTDLPALYVLLPLVVLIMHICYVAKASLCMFQSICLSLVSTEEKFREEYVVSMKPGVERRIKEFILQRAKADQRKHKPYIALDHLYGWVTLIHGTREPDKDMVVPHLAKGAESRKDPRYPGSRPPLSEVHNLLLDELVKTDSTKISSVFSSSMRDSVGTARRMARRKNAHAGGTDSSWTKFQKDKNKQPVKKHLFRLPNQYCKQQMNDTLLGVISHMITGDLSNVVGAAKNEEPKSQTFSVSLLDFVVRAAFLLQKQATGHEITKKDETEDVETDNWLEANRQRNPIKLLNEDPENDKALVRPQQHKLGRTNEEDDEELKEQMADMLLQAQGMEMQVELRGKMISIIMSKKAIAYSKQAEQDELVQQGLSDDSAGEALGGVFAETEAASRRVSGICWGLTTRMSFSQKGADSVVGFGDNDNGHFTITGKGSIDGKMVLSASNASGEFRVELNWMEKGSYYYGETLDGGYENKTCEFKAVVDQVDEKEAVQKTIANVAEKMKNMDPEKGGMMQDGEDGGETQKQTEKALEKHDRKAERARRRKTLTKVVDQMFSKNLYHTGLRLEDLQSQMLKLQRLPKDYITDWLDLFEDRWAIEVSMRNKELMIMAGNLHPSENNPVEEFCDGLVSRATQFPEEDTGPVRRNTNERLDDLVHETAADVGHGQVEERARQGFDTDGLIPVPMSAIHALHEAQAFEYTWYEELRMPLKKKLEELRHELGTSEEEWRESVTLTCVNSGQVLDTQMLKKTHEEDYPIFVQFKDQRRANMMKIDPDNMRAAIRWVSLSFRASGGITTFRVGDLMPAVKRIAQAYKDMDLVKALDDVQRQRAVEEQNRKATEDELRELQAALDAQHRVGTPRSARPTGGAGNTLADRGETISAAPKALPPIGAARMAPGTNLSIAEGPGEMEPQGTAPDGYENFPEEVRHAKPKRSCRMCVPGGGDF